MNLSTARQPIANAVEMHVPARTAIGVPKTQPAAARLASATADLLDQTIANGDHNRSIGCAQINPAMTTTTFASTATGAVRPEPTFRELGISAPFSRKRKNESGGWRSWRADKPPKHKQ